MSVGIDAHAPLRRISVCVDDFGLHDGINQAVFALLAMGRVQAVSAMVGGVAWKQGARELRGIDAQQAEVGLHLDLTECPLHPKLRFTHRQLLVRASLRQLDAQALEAEFHAQLDAFELAMGRAPVYVDGHQHVHQLPIIRDVLLRVIQQRYAQAMPWLRSTRSAPQAAHLDRRTQLKSHIIAVLGHHAISTRAKALGLQQNRHLLGVYDFSGDAQGYGKRMQCWLAAAADGDVLMCHPALTAPASDAIAAARQVEYAVLSAAAFDTWLAAAKLRLLPMRQILASPQR
ncbi:MAG TPA: ChbG/HpnK family deacetylase [Thermomonas sp.]|jgi:predicted glycoside hydrolase/deacetylase ChbG (UPF0249 family)|uniref:ChbG/HpnK family deacetylase n=1 Tax=Thermomonas sp. TaxID=1971895 RepID=UPI002CB9D324|nr:ChbG/HpnK family deacetylase [Thermomonas sp.]HOV95559.1 ChbG/HpnK family deacetylase [Thermomonas sp.]